MNIPDSILSSCPEEWLPSVSELCSNPSPLQFWIPAGLHQDPEITQSVASLRGQVAWKSDISYDQIHLGASFTFFFNFYYFLFIFNFYLYFILLYNTQCPLDVWLGALTIFPQSLIVGGQKQQYIEFGPRNVKRHKRCFTKSVQTYYLVYLSLLKSSPGGSAGKESACKAGDLGSIPGLGRSPGGGKGYPLSALSVPGESCAPCSPWGHTESDTTG